MKTYIICDEHGTMIASGLQEHEAEAVAQRVSARLGREAFLHQSPDEVTDDDIRQLRTEAARHGDHAQALLCDLALGDVALDEDTTIESLRIAAFLSPADRRRIGAMDPDDYRTECARVIEAARGEI